MTKQLIKPQYKLGRKGLIFLIFLLNMTGPMSTDLYLSAFPTLLKEFNTTSNILNYTLVGFFISFAIGMLFIGPLSDKIGRKPVLLSGIFIYGLSSLFCSFSTSVEMLIFFRVTQAIGAGGMMLGTLGWTNYVQGLGWITFIGVSSSITLWVIFLKKGYKLHGM